MVLLVCNCDECIHEGECNTVPYCSDNYVPSNITSICPKCKQKNLEITETEFDESTKILIEYFYCNKCELTGRFYYKAKFNRIETDDIPETHYGYRDKRE